MRAVNPHPADRGSGRLLPLTPHAGEERKVAMRVDVFDFELPPERIALEPASPARQRADARRRRRRRADGFARLRPAGFPARRATRWSSTTRGSSRRGSTACASAASGRRDRGDADQARRRLPLARRSRARPRSSRSASASASARSSESVACLLAALDAEVEEKGEAGEVLLRFEFAGAALDEAIERLGAPPLPPYIAARRATGETDRADYQTMFAAEPGAVAAPTAGLHFTPVAGRADRGARRRAPSRHAACRRRHFPAGQGRGHRGPRDACGGGRGRRRRRPAALNAARAQGRAHRLRRHDLGARPRERRRRRGPHPRLRRRDVDLHHAGLPLPRRRRADDQFPPAALDAVHAGRAPSAGSRRCGAAYAHAIEAGYRFYSYGDACLLIGGRRSPGSDHERRASPFTVSAADGAARLGAIATPRGIDPHAGLHAGRHGGDRQGDASGGGARARRRHRALATPIT